MMSVDEKGEEFVPSQWRGLEASWQLAGRRPAVLPHGSDLERPQWTLCEPAMDTPPTHSLTHSLSDSVLGGQFTLTHPVQVAISSDLKSFSFLRYKSRLSFLKLHHAIHAINFHTDRFLQYLYEYSWYRRMHLFTCIKLWMPALIYAYDHYIINSIIKNLISSQSENPLLY